MSQDPTQPEKRLQNHDDSLPRAATAGLATGFEIGSSTPTPDPSGDSTQIWYRALVRCAYVTVAFLVVVCTLLLADYTTRVAKDPLNSDAYLALRAKVVANPADMAARETLRNEDQRLRQNYFRQRRFSLIGTWLVVAGGVVLLASTKAAVVLHRRLPSPAPVDATQDVDTQESTRARWCVAGLGVAVIVAAVTLNRTIPTELASLTTTSGQGIASVPAASIAESGTNRDITPPAAPEPAESSWPTPEELAANWPRFRGPGGLGIAAEMDLPISWDATSGEGILWKSPVPVPGNSSPVVWENRLFLTGADEKQRVVMCFDTTAGKLLWQTEIPGTAESTAKPPEVSDDTGFAAPTAVCDGRRVYAMFANGDIGAVDFDGKVVWSRSVGIPKNSYGHASSLAMWRDRVILQFDQGAPKDKLSRLMALDGATGKDVWSVPRDVANSWPSPIVTEHNGIAQVITCADPFAIAYNAADGSELWRCKCLRQDVGPSPVVAGDTLIVANEYPQLTAIRLGGKGDITDNEEFVLWAAEDNLPDSCSPVATAENVYLLASFGVLTCLDTKSGEVRWEWESEDMYSSSPTLVGDLVYLFGLESCHVLKPGKEGTEAVGEGKLGEECVTSPAFRDGRMFIRGKEHLFCIGKTGANAGSPATPKSDSPQSAEPTPDLPTVEEIATNWPRFRGPNGLGIAPAADLPTTWNAESGEGILWKTPVPVPGNSSPVVWDQKLFLTGADEKQRVVMGFDTAKGNLLWQTEIPGAPESTAKPPEVADDTGFAAPTAACDGRRVYAMFANGDIGAVDFDGKVVWSRSLGIPKNSYGHASSLAVWRDRVILQFDQGAPKDKLSRLIAIDGATGKDVWSVPRDVANSWPSPIVTEHNGIAQVITCADPFAIAYNAEDGSELWRCKCLRQDVGPSPVVAGDTLIVANEYPQLTAIRLGGHGDITDNKEFVLWTFEDNLPDSCSPVATAEQVFVLASYGMLTCLDTKSGEVRWEWESEDMYSSSPTLVGDRIYLFGLESCHVLKAGKEAAEVVGQGSLGEECVTSPAFGSGRMFIRGKEHLFCIGNP